MDEKSRLKRLHYRSWHRGCKETDLILGKFADEKFAGLDAALLEVYEKLLEEQDADIWNWLTAGGAPAKYAPLLDMMKEKVAGW